MAELQQFIGTMRVVVNVEDEIEAYLTLDRLQFECEGLLDAEDGDVVAVTQVTPFATDHLSPEEILVVLKRARNALIRTRVKDCYDIARMLDEQIYALAAMQDPTMPVQYDYSRMLTFVDAIFKRKEEPND